MLNAVKILNKQQEKIVIKISAMDFFMEVMLKMLIYPFGNERKNLFISLILFRNCCFVSELLKVERNDEYEKELWQLNIDERLKLIPALKEKGNKFYAQKLYDEAEDTYSRALAICEQLMIRLNELYYAKVTLINITREWVHVRSYISCMY